MKRRLQRRTRTRPILHSCSEEAAAAVAEVAEVAQVVAPAEVVHPQRALRQGAVVEYSNQRPVPYHQCRRLRLQLRQIPREAEEAVAAEQRRLPGLRRKNWRTESIRSTATTTLLPWTSGSMLPLLKRHKMSGVVRPFSPK